MTGTKLKDIAKLVRSKNAKAFLLTIDIMFETREDYERVKRSGVISKDAITKLYGIPAHNILLVQYDMGYSFKITFPRPTVQGSIEDGDIYGGQQHSPLLELEIP